MVFALRLDIEHRLDNGRGSAGDVIQPEKPDAHALHGRDDLGRGKSGR